MSLRGKPPETVQKRMKLMLYSPAGTGKTTAAIQFPKPYMIDCERGSEGEDYTRVLSAKGGAYFATTRFDDVLAEVLALLQEKHDYQTVIIDPLTVIYNGMCDDAIRSIAKNERKAVDDESITAYGRHKAVPDRNMKHLLDLLLRLDMNVVLTAHSKTKYVKIGDKMTEAGQTFDCFNKLDYIADYVFELEKRGNERFGIIRKSRSVKFPEGEAFPFSYAEIARRYGKEILERNAVPEVLATAEQVKQADELAAAVQLPHATLSKWFEKAVAAHWGEMSSDVIGKCITYMTSLKEKKNGSQLQPA